MLVCASYAQFRISMRPLRTLAAELDAIRGGRATRIAQRYPRELQPFVENLNRLLDRQDELVRKARDRAGSLAHGLKTPLTVLAGEVRRLEQRGLAEAAARIQEQLGAFRRHVDRELARARTSGASVARETHTDVEAVTNRLVRLMDRLPRGKELVWRAEIPEGLAVIMEPDDFAEVLGNLVDNARKWARSVVRIRAEQTSGGVIMTVEDDGPGFPPGSLERGVSHHDEPGSAGLGLAIARDVLAEYGAALAVGPGVPCRVSFELPSQSAPTSPPRKLLSVRV
jgi:signal transduction histidine kinase